MAALRCVIGEVRAVINKLMLNRETIKPPHLATLMQVGTQPLQLQALHQRRDPGFLMDL